MKTNLKQSAYVQTHEGALTPKQNAETELRRTVMACLLWEKTFYESGESIADRIADLVSKVPAKTVSEIAIEARTKMKLRHVPLLLVREMVRHHSGDRLIGDTIVRVIRRPDEMGELISLYWKEGKKPLPNQMKIGLSRAFKKFDEYQLAKWDNPKAAVRVRDVLFLCHVKPDTDEQTSLFKRVAEQTMAIPETWETQLSGGGDKKAVFTGLLEHNKLGAMALLRNLRGMIEAGVSEDLIRSGLERMKVERVLPFRFIAAARHAPRLEDALELAMFKGLAGMEKLPGKTALLIDHSSSMEQSVSKKSTLSRFDAAAAVAMILRETAERVRVFTFSDRLFEVPPRRGFALLSAVQEVIMPRWTLLGAAVKTLYREYPECDRLIVITDEQSADRPPHPQGRGYIVNVGGYENGIGYGPWTTINGWSEAIVEYIRQSESA